MLCFFFHQTHTPKIIIENFLLEKLLRDILYVMTDLNYCCLYLEFVFLIFFFFFWIFTWMQQYKKTTVNVCFKPEREETSNNFIFISTFEKKFKRTSVESHKISIIHDNNKATTLTSMLSLYCSKNINKQ